ncbi:MAG: hypothetical protein AAGA76_11165, partial [Pseudomonadota bacterium]
ICLVEFDGVEKAKNLFELLVKIKICNPELIEVSYEHKGPEVLKPRYPRLVETIDWTEKKSHYDNLLKEWPDLLR